MHRRWLVNRTNSEYIIYLSKIASISPVLAQILINRGIKTPYEIYDFLNPRISNLSDPFELVGLKTAVERIKEALRRGEKILVHGDYDADGLSATAIVVYALKGLGLDVHYFIPNRITHGYGFNLAGVKKAKELGVKLIITVDSGITSFEAVALSKKEGIDVIITDHHEPLISRESWVRSPGSEVLGQEFLLPDAVAIINPKLLTPDSRLSTLSGAGVAFKFTQALSTSHDSRFTIHEFLDLAAIGTIADVVPITGENRIIVKEGLRLIENETRPGLKALKKVSGIDEREIKSGLLPFTMIPRMNAAGRISDANNVVRLLLTDSDDEAAEISFWLDKLNSERQQIEEEVYREALNKLNDKGVRSAIVLSGEGWHQGVIGIVASKIAEIFYRPTFVISKGGSTAIGSARSIPPFDIYKGLTGCGELLTGFGGHKQAAGFRLNPEDISSFEERINRIVKETLIEVDFIPSLEIDADVNLSHINFNLIRELKTLEPLGFGNSEPLLGSKGLEVISPRIVGNNHMKMKLRQGSHSIDAIGFDMAALFDTLLNIVSNSTGSTLIDAAFTPFINEWEGGRGLQLNLKAFRPSP
ncbi:MAG: single-stranded-DNA-specific exonuclease RecJ [Thermodesulfovibrionales bacterium]|nr:single-stranded-DNA-specific exonuclease RecJ [Thermodesulfovibrionales bacterium]